MPGVQIWIKEKIMAIYKKGQGPFDLIGRANAPLHRAARDQNDNKILDIEDMSTREAGEAAESSGVLGAARVYSSRKPAANLKPGEIGPVSGTSLAKRKGYLPNIDNFLIDKSEGDRDTYK